MSIGWIHDLGMGIGHGIVKGAHAIGGAVRKIPGQMHLEDDEEPSFLHNERPPIALPGMNAQGGAMPPRQPMRKLAAPAESMPALPSAPNVQTPTPEAPAPPQPFGGLGGAPPLTRNTPMPPAQTAQQSAPIEDLPAQPPLGPAPTRNVPTVMVPPLPGSRGGALEDTPYNRARYEYVTEPMNDEGKIPRSFKGTLQNAGLGAIRAIKANPRGGLSALAGGAVSGGAEALISPTSGRTSVFEDTQGRAIQADEQRQAQRRTQAANQEAERLKNEHLKAQTDAITQGKAKDNYIPLSGGGLYDIENQDFIREPNNPATRAAAVNPMWQETDKGYVDKRTGQPVLDVDGNQLQAYHKPERQPGEKTNAQADIDRRRVAETYSKLKGEYTAADSDWQVARGELVKNPKDAKIKTAYDNALAKRQAALNKLNSHVQSSTTMHPEDYEGGIGEGGVGYLKPKTGASRPAARDGKKGQASLSEFNSSKFPGWTPQR